MSQQSHPWDKRPDETQREYQAFMHFLMAHPRPSCRQIADQLAHFGVCYRTYHRWHKKNEWQARADAYDAHMVQIELRAREETAKKHGEDDELEAYRNRLISSAKMLHGLGLALGAKVVKDLQALGKDPIPPALSTAARATGQITQIGLDAEAGILGLNDIIGALSRSVVRDAAEE